jgi:uncharacterized membrane protein YjfL (UPF0719 family)
MTSFKRTKALADKSAWMLMIPSIIALCFIDMSMLKTLLQWLVFAPVLAGVAVIVSRIVFPQIHLSTLVEQTEEGNTAAGILASALVLFVALIVLALVMWAKA